MADRRRGDDLRFGRLGAVEQRRQAALAHDRDAVGKRQDLVEVGGDEQDADALRGEAAHDAEHVALGADVDAAARLVHQQHLGRGHQRLADHHLLLVAAGQRRDGQGGVGDLDRQVAHLALHLLGLAARRNMEALRQLLEARHGQVLGDREDRHQPVALAVLGDQREAAGDAAADVALAHRLAVDEDAAGRGADGGP